MARPGGKATTIRRRRGARLAGPALDAAIQGEGGASQQPFHDPRQPNALPSRRSSTIPNGVPIDAMLFGARRQRRVPLVYRSPRLAARNVPRRHALVGNHGRRHRQGRRAAARSDGHAAVLRLQHGATTSRTGSKSARPVKHAAENLPRELVSHQQNRAIHLAGIRRQPPRAAVGPRAVRRPRRRRRDA